jgi:hypothetical protein
MQPPLLPEHLVGVFRIEAHLCRAYAADSDQCEPAAARERQSNAFEVRH